MAATETLLLVVKGDTSDAVRSLGDLERSGKKIQDTDNRMQALGSRMTRTLTPAFAGVGAASAIAFQKFDAGADALRAAGATGDGFVDSMKKVGNEVPASLEEVGTVMGELYQRTQLTGEPLEELTQQVIELGEVGQHVDVEQLTASLSKSGVAAEDMADALDVMFRVAQTTGTSVSKLSELQEQFGASLDLAGFSMEDQLLLLGQMEKSGVNTSTVMAGMTRGLRDLAAAGEDPAQALAELMDRMKGAKTDAEAVAIANDVFGRSAVEVSAAVRNGSLDLGDMQAALAGNTDSIHEAAAGTRDWQEKLAMAQNRLIGIAGPLGQYGMAISAIGMVAGPAVSGVGKLIASVQNAGGAMTLASRAATFTSDNWKSMAAGAGVAAGGLALLTYGLQNNAKEAEQAARVNKALTDALLESGDSASVASDAVTELVENNDFLRDMMNEAGISVSEVAAALDEGGPAWDAMSERLVATGEGGDGAAAKLDMVSEAFGKSKTAAEESAVALDINSEATGTAAGKQRDMERSTKDVNDVLQGEIDKLNELYDTVNSSIDAAYAYEESQYDTLDSIQAMIDMQTNAEASASDVARANNDAETAVLDQSRAAVELKEQWAAANGVTLTAADRTRAQRDELLRLKDQFPELSAQIDGFIAALDRIPAFKSVDISVKGGGGMLPPKEFDTGGVVPGPRGAPQLIVAHGGETVLPTHKTGGRTAMAATPTGGGFPDRLYLILDDGQKLTAHVSKTQRRTGLERV